MIRWLANLFKKPAPPPECNHAWVHSMHHRRYVRTCIHCGLRITSPIPFGQLKEK